MAEIRTQPVTPNTELIARCVGAAREELSFDAPPGRKLGVPDGHETGRRADHRPGPPRIRA